MSGLSQKADIALSQLASNGGLLLPEQSDRFIRNILDQPVILGEMRYVPMNAPEMRINKIGFGSRILAPANQDRTTNTANYDGRYFKEPLRAAPTTSQISMSTREIMAEVRITYEVLEDNIERGNLENTILELMAERVALDMEELVIRGDTALAGSDPYLGLMDGVLKLTNANVVDAAGGAIGVSLFNNAKKAMPTRYRRNLSTMRFFTSMDRESDYRVQVASRGTDLGDAILTGTAPLPVLGVPMRGVALMPNSQILFANPQNYILGVQRQIRIETDKDIRSREVIIVLTMRVALQVEEVTATVKVINMA